MLCSYRRAPQEKRATHSHGQSKLLGSRSPRTGKSLNCQVARDFCKPGALLSEGPAGHVWSGHPMQMEAGGATAELIYADMCALWFWFCFCSFFLSFCLVWSGLVGSFFVSSWQLNWPEEQAGTTACVTVSVINAGEG